MRAKVAAELREADAVCLDQLPLTWEADALAAPLAEWAEAAGRLDQLLDEHGVEADAVAVLAAPPKVGTAWRHSSVAARAALHAVGVVAELDEVPGSPLDDGSTIAWWTPSPQRHRDTIARAVAARSWSPSQHPVEVLPVRAREAGLLLGPVDHVAVLRRERAWEATAPAREALDMVQRHAVANGGNAASILAAQPHLARAVEDGRQADDGIGHDSTVAAA